MESRIVGYQGQQRIHLYAVFKNRSVEHLKRQEAKHWIRTYLDVYLCCLSPHCIIVRTLEYSWITHLCFTLWIFCCFLIPLLPVVISLWDSSDILLTVIFQISSTQLLPRFSPTVPPINLDLSSSSLSLLICDNIVMTAIHTGNKAALHAEAFEMFKFYFYLFSWTLNSHFYQSI